MVFNAKYDKPICAIFGTHDDDLYISSLNVIFDTLNIIIDQVHYSNTTNIKLY